MDWDATRLTQQKNAAITGENSELTIHERCCAGEAIFYVCVRCLGCVFERCVFERVLVVCSLSTRGCFSWVVRHDEGVCYINTNDIQEGTFIPPTCGLQATCLFACDYLILRDRL